MPGCKEFQGKFKKSHIFFSPWREEENAESVSKLCVEILVVVLAGHGLAYICKGKIKEPVRKVFRKRI